MNARDVKQCSKISTLPIVAAVAGCGIVGALVDIKTRRVPNPLTLGIAVTGLAFAATRWSGLSVATAALGLAVGIGLMLLPYMFGAMGGGDVKLFAALGTFLGPWPTVQAFLYTLMAGGLLAVCGRAAAAPAPRDGRPTPRSW